MPYHKISYKYMYYMHISSPSLIKKNDWYFDIFCLSVFNQYFYF